MTKVKASLSIGYIGQLKEEIFSANDVFEVGDEVQIVNISEEGYTIMKVDSGSVIHDCGFENIFK